jgi:hypothetical protein
MAGCGRMRAFSISTGLRHDDGLNFGRRHTAVDDLSAWRRDRERKATSAYPSGK